MKAKLTRLPKIFEWVKRAKTNNLEDVQRYIDRELRRRLNGPYY